MGKLISIYKGTGIGSQTWIFIILPTLAAISFALYFGTVIARQNYLKHGPASALFLARPWYITAAVLIIFLALYFIYRLLCSLRRIYIFENGIVYRNLLLIRRQYHWIDLQGINSSARGITLNNKLIRTEPIGYVNPKTGKPIKLTKRFQHIPQLTQEIKAMFYPQIWPKLKSSYFSGKEINFGRISVSNKHLSISENPISWELIYQLKVESGDVLVELHGKNHYRVPAEEVQNLELLFRMVELVTS